MTKRQRSAKEVVSRETLPEQLSRIGYVDAESDEEFLEHCFIRTPQFERLNHQPGPECIISGRTGSGKSALIWGIKNNNENVIEISPHDLAIDYIVGSDIIKFCEKLDVKLNLFFEYLWRHVLIVDLLNAYFKRKKKSSFKEGVQDLFAFGRGGEAENKARQYLERWGSQFWQETVERITELTSELETKIAAETGLSSERIRAIIQGSVRFKESHKREYSSQVQRVINSIQIKELTEVSNVLTEKIFSDKVNKYYIVIDRLDEDWVDDNLRYKLIRALIETAKWVRRLKSVKLIIALRNDYLERTFRLTQDTGFQREKYEDYIVEMTWSEASLKNLIESRFDYVFRELHKNLNIFDVLPDKVGQKPIFDYILMRTLLRPRDVIKFINEILNEYSKSESIGREKIEAAEKRYSLSRINALRDEWKGDFKYAENFIRSLSGLPRRFTLSELEALKGHEIITELASLMQSAGVVQMAKNVFEEKCAIIDVLREHMTILYKIGCIGIKDEYTNRVSYSYTSKPEIDVHEVHPGSVLAVHPMLYSCLGIGAPVKGRIVG